MAVIDKVVITIGLEAAPDLREFIRDAVREEVAASVCHCTLCGTSPISRVVACDEVDCPARRPLEMAA